MPGYEFSEDRNGGVYVTRMPERWRIVRLNRLFANIGRKLERREGVCGPSNSKWQRAWDRNPDLRALDQALMQHWMRERDYDNRMAEKACVAEQRRRRAAYAAESSRRYEASKCPTCGSHTLAKAA